MRIPVLVAFGFVGQVVAGLATTSGAEPAPRLVAAWPAGLMEVRVAFDRPVDPALATASVGTSIDFGAAGPGAEAGRPGGDRGRLRIAAARLADDGRTLILVTDPHPRDTAYLLTLPGVKAAGDPGPGGRLDLSYDLAGVEVSWAAEGSSRPTWAGWWPHTDPDVARGVVGGSAEHDRLWPLLAGPGKLSLRSLVTPKEGGASLSLDAGAPFEATLGQAAAQSTTAPTTTGTHRATLKADAAGEAIELGIVLTTGPGDPPRLRVSAGNGREPATRALTRSAFLLPWAPTNPSAPAVPEVPTSALAGGDPTRGEAVFYGEQAKCATCHAVRGKGGAVGPDLSELAGRDRAWVYRNIVEPSLTIHPEYASYTVALKDGRIAMGVVRAEGADAVKVGDIDAKQTVFPRAEVEEIRPSATSIMPVGLLGAIGEERTRDLIAFLTARRDGAASGRD